MTIRPIKAAKVSRGYLYRLNYSFVAEDITHEKEKRSGLFIVLAYSLNSQGLVNGLLLVDDNKNIYTIIDRYPNLFNYSDLIRT